MTDEEFIAAVSARAGLPEDRAEAITAATLSTLADRLTAGEADDLASQLPGRLKEMAIPGQPEAERFGLDEFVRLVAERADVPADEARRGVTAVLTTLRQAVTAGEFDDVMSQLPNEFATLVDPTVPPPGP